MITFTIQLQRPGEQLSLDVVKLDPWPDADGYERYGLTGAGINCIISLDAAYWASLAEDDYEKSQSPSRRPFFCNTTAFTNAELRAIANQIAHADQ